MLIVSSSRVAKLDSAQNLYRLARDCAVDSRATNMKQLQLRASLAVSRELSQQITADMLQQMHRGLLGDRDSSTLLMLPSWLPSLPTGREHGVVFAIDFGGTSFRVMEVALGKAANEVVRCKPPPQIGCQPRS